MGGMLSERRASAGSPPPPAGLEPGSTALRIPSRFLPAAAILIAVVTIFGSVASCLAHGHDVGGVYWPYISDTAKDMPQAGFFAYGMTLTSTLIFTTVLVHHGKVKLQLYALRDGERDNVGQMRARWARVAGCFAAPNLGLLASYDTSRSPVLHLVFVLLFFIPMLVYFACIVSVYRLLVCRQEYRIRNGKPRLPRKSYVSLHTSLRWKQRIVGAFSIFFIAYLPLGMCLVSDWTHYERDVTVHTFRAVMQHGAVLCIVLFFGTMWHDFGGLVFRIVQTAE